MGVTPSLPRPRTPRPPCESARMRPRVVPSTRCSTPSSAACSGCRGARVIRQRFRRRADRPGSMHRNARGQARVGLRLRTVVLAQRPKVCASWQEFPAVASETPLPVGGRSEPAAANAPGPDAVWHPVVPDDQAREFADGLSVRANCSHACLARLAGVGGNHHPIGPIHCHDFHTALLGIRGSGATKSTAGRRSGHCCH